jgi:hypothetical protein
MIDQYDEFASFHEADKQTLKRYITGYAKLFEPKTGKAIAEKIISNSKPLNDRRKAG